MLEEKRRGATILLSSHLFDEVSARATASHSSARAGWPPSSAWTTCGRAASACSRDVRRRGRARPLRAGASRRAETGAASVEAAVAGNPDAFVKTWPPTTSWTPAREQTLEELFMHLYGTTNQVEKGGS
ncbi:MAG: hypothetical protein ACLSVD_11120 [Eggerthellaceae bacterium]